MKSVVAIPVVLVATAILVAYLVFIWWLDRYEREPLWLVALVFGWGATIGAGCGCAINTTLLAPFQSLLSREISLGLGAIVLAPVVEELTKGLVFIPLVWTDHFDNETDGLIYGAATGLGFAAVENLMYFAKFVASPEISVAGLVGMAAVRTLFTAVMHCISGAILGMAVGYARHRPDDYKWLLYPGLGYVVAAANHSLWNAAAFLSNIHTGFQLAGIGLLVVAALALFGLTQFSLKREHEVIQTFLHREAERGVLPESHADIVPYWTKRRRDDWLPDGVPRESYVEAATLLAFRLHQRDLAADERRDEYEEDIELYRRRLRELLS